MACINMYNPDHQGASLYQMSGPRISFSSDFIDGPPAPAPPRGPPCPGDPDFEFSVGTHHMMAADQLFFKGRILPLKESSSHGHAQFGQQRVTTLRDELRAQDEHAERPPKGSVSVRWKELLGLRKGGHKKGDKTELATVSETSEANFGRFGQETGM